MDIGVCAMSWPEFNRPAAVTSQILFMESPPALLIRALFGDTTTFVQWPAAAAGGGGEPNSRRSLS
jgi:hypothetical protein